MPRSQNLSRLCPWMPGCQTRRLMSSRYWRRTAVLTATRAANQFAIQMALLSSSITARSAASGCSPRRKWLKYLRAISTPWNTTPTRPCGSLLGIEVAGGLAIRTIAPVHGALLWPSLHTAEPEQSRTSGRAVVGNGQKQEVYFAGASCWAMQFQISRWVRLPRFALKPRLLVPFREGTSTGSSWLTNWLLRRSRRRCAARAGRNHRKTD